MSNILVPSKGIRKTSKNESIQCYVPNMALAKCDAAGELIAREVDTL